MKVSKDNYNKIGLEVVIHCTNDMRVQAERFKYDYWDNFKRVLIK